MMDGTQNHPCTVIEQFGDDVAVRRCETCAEQPYSVWVRDASCFWGVVKFCATLADARDAAIRLRQRQRVAAATRGN